MENPVEEMLTVLSSADIHPKKIQAGMRKDGITYVLAEVDTFDTDALLFSGEVGAKILRHEAITK